MKGMPVVEMIRVDRIPVVDGSTFDMWVVEGEWVSQTIRDTRSVGRMTTAALSEVTPFLVAACVSFHFLLCLLLLWSSDAAVGPMTCSARARRRTELIFELLCRFCCKGVRTQT